MKQQLRRLKGTTIPTSIGQIVMKECTRLQQSQYDQLYFTCNQQFLLCKVYNITNDTSIQRYQHQKQIYEMDIYPNLARCINKTEMNFRKINYAIFVLDQIPRNANILQIGNSLSTSQLLQLTKTVLQLIKQLKNRNQVYLNIRPQNIYLNSEKNFIIINPEYICPKGTHSTLQDCNELFFSNVEKYYKYNSPQVLDNYTYFNIDAKSDCFSLGCILYETIYGKYPFQSKFANINIIYQIQEGFFGKFIGRIFRPYKERADVEELLKLVDDQIKKNPSMVSSSSSEPKMINTSSTAQSSKSNKNAHSFFDDLSSVFNKYTKQTQGAYINFTEDNESFPQAKHLAAILNKLYKNPNKVQKLQSIMSKHIKLTQYNKRKNFIIKNLVLVLLILRKNRNYMINRWRDNVNEIKNIVGQNSQCMQLSELLIKKINLQQQLNCILRGNFYLQDLCQFKLLSIGNLQSMIRYLQAAITFATKLLTYKQDDYLFHYVLQSVCDEIYDLISMIIFCVISITKDNQLGLRKDNLVELTPIEKVLNVILKKINNLSNKISSHPIYSIQPDYYNYKEDIYLKQQPQHTSFQYFVKHCNYYKGLALPQTNNFSSFNDSENKQFGSFQNNQSNITPTTGINKPLSKGVSNKFYGNQISSDEDEGDSSKKYIGVKEILQSNANDNNFSINEKELKLKKQASISLGNNNQQISGSTTNKPVNNNNINNLFGNDFFNKPSQILKKAKSSEKPFTLFNLQPKPNQTKQQSPKVGFDDFTNFFNDSNSNKKPQNTNNNFNLLQKKDSVNTKSVESKQNKSIEADKKADIFQNFSFFHQQSNKNKNTVKESNTQKKQQDLSSNWIDFNQPTKKSTQNQQKQGLKIDPKILKQDIFNYDWLKKSQQNPFGIFVQPKDSKPAVHHQQPQPQKLSPFITEIISSLRLKQLKDLILNNKQVAIEFDKLIFDKVIGSGSAGQVYLGKYQNQFVAIKKVKIKQNPNALKEFQRQLVTYIKIKKNPYLVSLIGLSKSGEDFYLLTEFCSGGSLFDLLHKKAGQIFLTWKTKMSLILQIAKGMKALHDMRPPIIHRDLKSLNVFIAQQNNDWIAKVADFGLSRSPEAQMMTMALGTLHWMAPELLDNKQYSLKVDVYSFAIVMWEICARKTPYYELSNPMAIMKYVTIDKKRPNMTIIDINCPTKLLQLIQICWDQEPNKRPLFKQIIEILTQIDSMIPSQ